LHVESKVLVVFHPSQKEYVRALVDGLNYAIRVHFDFEERDIPDYPANLVVINVQSDPLFFADGSVTFP
jgi:hypothetical protein